MEAGERTGGQISDSIVAAGGFAEATEPISLEDSSGGKRRTALEPGRYQL